LRAQLELAQGDLPAACYWAASSGLSTSDVSCYPHEQAYLTLARVRLAEERVGPTGDGLSDVLFLLGQLLAKAEISKRWHSVLEILLLLALALGGARESYSSADHAEPCSPAGRIRRLRPALPG
jgi:hypothetical protein